MNVEYKLCLNVRIIECFQQPESHCIYAQHKLRYKLKRESERERSDPFVRTEYARCRQSNGERAKRSYIERKLKTKSLGFPEADSRRQRGVFDATIYLLAPLSASINPFSPLLHQRIGEALLLDDESLSLSLSILPTEVSTSKLHTLSRHRLCI